MRMLGRVGAIALCSVALLAQAAAPQAEDPAPQQLLRQMNASLRSVDYQGSFIYEHDGRIDALRIFHLGGAQERERLISLNGARGEIVRSDRTITCVQPAGIPTLFANRADARLLPLVPNVRELGTQYSVSLAGDDRVAGYDARIIDIAPRDPYRYGYRLWLQKDNLLLLRSAVVDAARRTLEQFMFVALDVGARPSETDLLPSGDAAGAVSPADEVPISARPLWSIDGLPPGFRLVRAQKPLGGAPDEEHLVYSDGIASVSVYIEPHAASVPAEVESAVVHGVLSIHSRDAGGVRVTAVGDVPPVTVQAMARGVRSSAPR